MRRGARTLQLASAPALAAIAFAVGAGCAGSPAAVAVAQADPGREAAERVRFEHTLQGQLDCAAGVCRRWYRLEQSTPGELQVDVQARTGRDVPDFDVRLEAEDGELLWGFAPTGSSPRRVRRVLGPGTYYLLLTSVGDVRGPLVFEILARVGAPEWPLPAPGAVGARPDLPSSPLTPRRPEFWIHAEIVRVEGSAGLPTFVEIDAGSRDDLRVGFGGELLEQGAAIAVFELIHVDPSSSRARLLRPPSAAITYATRARIRVPLPDPSAR